MSDDAPRKRPWFRFHLSTCIVLMFVAGGVIWANVVPNQVPGKTNTKIVPYRIYAVEILGWPASYKRSWRLAVYSRRPLFSRPTEYAWDNLFLDVAIALSILAAVGFALEWGIRRRERMKDSAA